MKRLYDNVIIDHFQHHKQMLFLAGPRQVGKTTIGLSAQALTKQFVYLNWDNQDHRQIILKGPKTVAEQIEPHKLHAATPIIMFDELHKYRRWKIFLKGFFDTYKDMLNIVVTGSSKLDIYRTGGDSLMGRYFPYRIHPVSVAECLTTDLPHQEIQPPKQINPQLFQTLLEFGGFPEPFLKKNQRFSRRWKQLRQEQLFRGDIRDLSHIQEVDQLEMLAELLKHQAGQLVSYTNLSNKIRVSIDTIRRWITLLNAFYYCFTIKPWSKNISRSLLKEPKIYLWDWSDVEDIGLRAENFIAAHLLKAVHFWTDTGFGKYALYFLRDKEKREVDFIITKDNHPWFLVEVKSSENTPLSRHLEIFQQQTKAKHAFQVAMDMEHINIDCFSYHKPIIVPACTLLSQLV